MYLQQQQGDVRERKATKQSDDVEPKQGSDVELQQKVMMLYSIMATWSWHEQWGEWNPTNKNGATRE